MKIEMILKGDNMFFQRKKSLENQTKYIFFDIDGVLNTENTWKIPYQLIDTKIKLLAKLQTETNARLVLISTWRLGYDSNYDKCSEQIKKLIDLFKQNNIFISDITPILKNRSRDAEIERFLYFHPCDRYVVLDDDDSLYIHKENIVKIDSKIGLTHQNIKTAKAHLM